MESLAARKARCQRCSERRRTGNTRYGCHRTPATTPGFKYESIEDIENCPLEGEEIAESWIEEGGSDSDELEKRLARCYSCRSRVLNEENRAECHFVGVPLLCEQVHKCPKETAEETDAAYGLPSGASEHRLRAMAASGRCRAGAAALAALADAASGTHRILPAKRESQKPPASNASKTKKAIQKASRKRNRSKKGRKH